jgi:hypothetical protein
MQSVIVMSFGFLKQKYIYYSLEVIPQLTNTEIVRSDVVARVRTQDLTVMCEFNFSGLPLHLKPKKKKIHLLYSPIIRHCVCVCVVIILIACTPQVSYIYYIYTGIV